MCAIGAEHKCRPLERPTGERPPRNAGAVPNQKFHEFGNSLSTADERVSGCHAIDYNHRTDTRTSIQFVQEIVRVERPDAARAPSTAASFDIFPVSIFPSPGDRLPPPPPSRRVPGPAAMRRHPRRQRGRIVRRRAIDGIGTEPGPESEPEPESESVPKPNRDRNRNRNLLPPRASCASPFPPGRRSTAFVFFAFFVFGVFLDDEDRRVVGGGAAGVSSSSSSESSSTTSARRTGTAELPLPFPFPSSRRGLHSPLCPSQCVL